MSVDMSQFYGVFFEESQEHLDDMEHLLMDLSLDEPDIEELNSIFRAAHSIKGGSGVFGFDALTGLTHVMENILDLARQNELVVTKTIVDQLLITVDTLKNILECYQNEDEIDWDEINKGTQALEALLKDEGVEETPTSEDEGFGFFEETVTSENSSSETNTEDGFGFFDEIQTDEETTAESSNEDGFGFFEDSESPTAEKMAAKEKDEAEDGFGFFETIENEPAAQNKPNNSNKSGNNAPAVAKDSTTGQPKVTKPIKTNATKKPSAAKKSKADTKESGSIRVDTLKIDSLVNLVGELVITQSMIKIVGRDVHGEVEEKLDGAISELSRNIREIQEAVMSMRMLPMSFAFNRFPRVIRDLADKLDKEVELIIEGGNTEIDKGLIEKLVDPLTHLIRNSIDHGIEMPDAREAKGKMRKGTVILAAEQRGGNIIISITDDGAGLNRDKILEKAMANGLDVSEDMPDEKVWPLIFEAGFSTAEAVTDVSGRGVGMDVVRRNIESIGGLVEIESHEGTGSVFKIRLPLTLAIVDGMCVSVAEQTFVIPLTNIVESMQPAAEQIKTLKNDHLLWVRDEYWPLIALHDFMSLDNAISEPTEAIVVLVETSRKRFGILVDGLEGQQQVVIKSLEQHYKKVPGVAGATIMGDGSVAMILDVESIATEINTVTPQEVSIAS
ncbi:chemotaxis protein CheA [Glaciecola petra]|uniref:Chemotaxis protein CheA n=1 Tax=Glaciecola petra TaxID=3075602 RepID=A0ABU2ZRH1_9ALTE|nr:chemotaxis protein CheA [Aestuariibacter sp. P117]MDT0595229.1 chemotaxis protein CheA [Aestuariibacter sp. P117]